MSLFSHVLLLCGSMSAFTAFAECPAGTLSLGSLPSLIEHRFASHSPQGLLAGKNQLRHTRDTRILDPMVRLRHERPALDSPKASWRATLEQEFPYGLSLSASEEFTENGRRVLSASAQQDLLAHGPWWGDVKTRIADTEEKIRASEADDAFNGELHEALQKFIAAQSAQARLAATRGQRDRAQEDLTLVRDLIAKGYKPPAEEYLVEGRLLARELALTQAEDAQRQAKAELLLSLHFPAACTVNVATEFDDKLLTRFRQTARGTSSPMVARAELDLTLAEVHAARATRDSLPSLAARVSVSKERERDETASVSLELSMPLVSTLGANEASLARMDREQAHRRLRMAQDEHTMKMDQLTGRITVAERRVSTSERILELQRRTLAAERANYADGTATITDVTAAVELVNGAELELIEARADLLRSWLALARHTATLREALHDG